VFANLFLDDNSANNKMLTHLKNPPATLTTNATTKKHTEAIHLTGIPSQPTNSKKAREIKSLEQIDDEYFELLKRQYDNPYHQQLELEEPNLKNDLIVEEDHE
jgi:hypothetical protein